MHMLSMKYVFLLLLRMSLICQVIGERVRFCGTRAFADIRKKEREPLEMDLFSRKTELISFVVL